MTETPLNALERCKEKVRSSPKFGDADKSTQREIIAHRVFNLVGAMWGVKLARDQGKKWDARIGTLAVLLGVFLLGARVEEYVG